MRGKAVTLRTPKVEDLPFLGALMADLRVRRGGQIWDEPAAPATWKERLKEAAKDEHTVIWTVDADGAAAGYLRVSFGGEAPQHCDLRELVIAPERWRAGLGTDAAVALHRYLFDYLDKTVVGVEVPADNAAALRLAAKLGYAEFGRGHEVYYRDGAYADQVFLRLDRPEWEARWPAEREYEPFPEGTLG